jgi:uncharacterized protein (DUF433 family)
MTIPGTRALEVVIPAKAGSPLFVAGGWRVEHILAMLAAGDTPEAVLEGYPWLEREDIQACLVYARRVTANERI